MTYNYPQIGRATTNCSSALLEVVLVQACCGRPMISKGLVAEARACASKNVEVLKPPHRPAAFPVLGCEPSCLLTLRDEYPDLLQGEAVQKLAQRSF